MVDKTFPINIPPLLGCPKCSKFITPFDKLMPEYFQGGKATCPFCSKDIDCWKIIFSSIKDRFDPFKVFSAIGACSDVFEIKLKPGEITKIDFRERGLPENGKILSVGYLPVSGGLFPLEIHGNTPQRHFIPKEIHLFPRPLEQESIGETIVRVSFVWIDDNSEDESWRNLCDAFEAYSNKQYNSAIIPANVAVESKLSQLLQCLMSKSASKKRVSRFLTGTPYSYLLNVVLPSLLEPKGIPFINDHIRVFLNTLRDHRNNLAHEGCLEKDLKQEDMAELLCAALFGFRYMLFVQSEISKI